MNSEHKRQFHPVRLVVLLVLAVSILLPVAVFARGSSSEGTPQVYAGAGALLDPRSDTEDLPDADGVEEVAVVDKGDISGNTVSTAV